MQVNKASNCTIGIIKFIRRDSSTDWANQNYIADSVLKWLANEIIKDFSWPPDIRCQYQTRSWKNCRFARRHNFVNDMFFCGDCFLDSRYRRAITLARQDVDWFESQRFCFSKCHFYWRVLWPNICSKMEVELKKGSVLQVLGVHAELDKQRLIVNRLVSFNSLHWESKLINFYIRCKYIWKPNAKSVIYSYSNIVPH